MVVFFFGGGWSFNVLFLRRLNKRVLSNTKIVKLKCFIYSNHSYFMRTCALAHMRTNKISTKIAKNHERVAETMFSKIFGERNSTKTSKYYF